MLDPERFNPNEPPGCTLSVLVVAAAVVLLCVIRYMGNPKLFMPCNDSKLPFFDLRLMVHPRLPANERACCLPTV